MEDIARRLHIAPGTVKSRTHRARAALDRLRAQARNEPPHN
jgi:DNA-directed RNA polymerase specialized sigma24 family protein